MSRLTLSLVGAIAAGGIAASLLLRHSGQVRLREAADLFRQQADQIARLSAENARLSNAVARTTSPQALPPDQFLELLRLRNQVTRLGHTTTEQTQLQATNAALRVAMAAAEQQLAAARSTPNFWPREKLAFAGYADPEATLKTWLWAMNNGDGKAFLACYAFESPEQRAEAEKSPEIQRLAENLAPSAGFHVTDKQMKSADEAILHLSFDGENKVRTFVLKRIGGEWKIADMLRPGEAEP